MWVGVWLFFLPFLGLPGNWKDRLLILTSIVILVCAFLDYRRAKRTREVEGGTGAVSEGVVDDKTSTSEPTH